MGKNNCRCTLDVVCAIKPEAAALVRDRERVHIAVGAAPVSGAAAGDALRPERYARERNARSRQHQDGDAQL